MKNNDSIEIWNQEKAEIYSVSCVNEAFSHVILFRIFFNKSVKIISTGIDWDNVPTLTVQVKNKKELTEIRFKEYINYQIFSANKSRELINICLTKERKK